MNRTVLITGASAGIGAALARTYAAEGWNVILTARRKGPLQILADELTAAHGVTATVIPEDLSDPAAPERLVATLGMRHTVAGTDWQGNYILSSDVYTTARDLARLGQFWLQDGVWQGRRPCYYTRTTQIRYA